MILHITLSLMFWTMAGGLPFLATHMYTPASLGLRSPSWSTGPCTMVWPPLCWRLILSPSALLQVTTGLGSPDDHKYLQSSCVKDDTDPWHDRTVLLEHWPPPSSQSHWCWWTLEESQHSEQLPANIRLL